MEPIDWNALKENCAGDESLVAEVLELFVPEAPALPSDIGAAVTQPDAPAVKRTAHRLKGALASLAARPSMLTCGELESMGSKGEISKAPDMFAQLQREMGELMAVVRSTQAAA